MIQNNRPGTSVNTLSREMYKNIILNYGFRAIGIILNLLLIRLTLIYLGTSLYGIWATIVSVASWTNAGDFGIGNGVRNSIAVANAEKDCEKTMRIIVTAVLDLMVVSGFFFILLTAITEILLYCQILLPLTKVPMYITNVFFCLDLILGVGRSIAYGLQKSWLTSFAQVGTVGLRVLSIVLLLILNKRPNLGLYAFVNGVGGVLANVVVLFMVLKITVFKRKKTLKQLYDSSLNKNIIGLGIRFFVLQLGAIVLYSTDNLIINGVLSSEEVTQYDIITKVFSTGQDLFAIVLISLWSAVTSAITNSDYNWIKKRIKEYMLMWGIFSIGVVIVAMLFNFIVEIWLGRDDIVYNWQLIALFAFYTIASTFGGIFVNISNGLGRLKVQLIFTTIETIANIPLSIFFARNLGYGIFGVKLATLICCVGAIVFVPVDVLMYLKRKGN